MQSEGCYEQERFVLGFASSWKGGATTEPTLTCPLRKERKQTQHTLAALKPPRPGAELCRV